MIEGFEEYTYELTQEEKLEADKIARILNRNPGEFFSAAELCRLIEVKNIGARVRKIMHHIRVMELVPCVIASGKGYTRAVDRAQVMKYIKSLDQRLRSIMEVRDSVKEQMVEQFTPFGLEA